MREIRILIADDQPLVRSGLKATFDAVPDIIIAGEAVNGVEAVRGVRRLNPDIVLMDIHMPRMDGLEATREIYELQQNDATKVIILTMYDQDEHVFEALRVGASGFILKDAPTEKLIEAVREVATGEALLSPSVTRRLIAEFARRPVLSTATAPELANLTDRELDVFKLLVRGYGNDDMAKMLVLGESTVKSHVQHLYQKLGVRNRVQVVIYAYENGLV
ncbi:response regulator [Planomonospora venezuelensis]|uniref:DNA-binding NarL/FixJ family response regulator n=1 Tax=Planomonospora venezuelensis TaxID=1999 RepID=A0A841D4M8_PLAVE|nr:response regulator transcription factor [Planomonospora venezuelensis]MBB5962416.1 DNA-binding NarL/FixJ family response regulator [Planomonospora venezuelensis]GIN00798.1 DNA-binding response regulator [Planomonospora venezuelensis]